MENCTGSHLENEVTATSSNMVRNASRQIEKPYEFVFHPAKPKKKIIY